MFWRAVLLLSKLLLPCRYCKHLVRQGTPAGGGGRPVSPALSFSRALTRSEAACLSSSVSRGFSESMFQCGTWGSGVASRVGSGELQTRMQELEECKKAMDGTDLGRVCRAVRKLFSLVLHGADWTGWGGDGDGGWREGRGRKGTRQPSSSPDCHDHGAVGARSPAGLYLRRRTRWLRAAPGGSGGSRWVEELQRAPAGSSGAPAGSSSANRASGACMSSFGHHTSRDGTGPSCVCAPANACPQFNGCVLCCCCCYCVFAVLG